MAEVVRYIVGTAGTPDLDGFLMGSGIATSTFERASDARSAIVTESREVAVVVGEHLLEVAPANFAGWAVGSGNVSGVVTWGWEPTPALLACGVTVLERPAERPRIHSDPRSQGIEPLDGRRGALIVVASARGGSGKTVIASLAAILAARCSIRTALIDLDLRFGDLEFVFDRVADHSLMQVAERVARGGSIARLGESIESGLTLFTAPDRPELGEEVAPSVPHIISALRSEFELTIVDTGGGWGEMHAELFDQADRILLLIDPFPVSVRAAARAWGLMERLRVPAARIVPVLNRWTDEGEVTPLDVAAALRVGMVRIVPEGSLAVAQSFAVGRPGSLVDAGSQVASGVQEILADELSDLGIEFTATVPELFGASRRRRW